MSKDSVVSQRRSLNASQMDAIGKMDEKTAQPVSLTLEKNSNKLTPPSSPVTAEIATRVDVGRPVEIPMEIDNALEEDDDVDADLERLLASNEDVLAARPHNGHYTKSTIPSCCGGCRKVGNTHIVFPQLHARTGWGVVGPHWFGPACVAGIIAWASHYFISEAIKIGPGTTTTCVLLTLATLWNLGSCSFRDPGIVMNHPSETVDLTKYRWCDFCKYVHTETVFDLSVHVVSVASISPMVNVCFLFLVLTSVYQPPDGSHCPDCNVCVEGYDHHCVWMGTCIGRGNYRHFLRFNLSWLIYLIYALSWVQVIAPSMYHTNQ